MLEPASPDRDTRIPRTARLDRAARDRPLIRGAATEHHGTGNQQWRRLFEGLQTVFLSGHCDWRRPGTRGAERAATKRRRSGLPRTGTRERKNAAACVTSAKAAPNCARSAAMYGLGLLSATSACMDVTWKPRPPTPLVPFCT